MAEGYFALPPTLANDINKYEKDVERFLAGDLTPAMMRARRVPFGIYEQRQDCSYMVRVRVAGGALTAEQARRLAALSAKYSNGQLHVTTRQDVQLHDIDLADTPPIMRSLLEVGLSSKGGGGNTVRNVAACPYAGICPHECFDVTPLAHAVTEYLIQQPGSYNLPRKYKIAFSGCAADCALAKVTDLGFIAETRAGEAGFRVLIGGGMGATSRLADELLDWTPASECIRIAEAVRRLFDRHGDRDNRQRARLRYVLERLGIDQVRALFHQVIGEVTNEGVPAWSGQCDANPAPITPTPESPEVERIDGILRLRQRQAGRIAVPLHLPLGFLSADEFARIGDIAARFSSENGVRTTRRQNLIIRSIPENALDELARELRSLDTDMLAPDPIERFVSCAGASTCRLGLCLSRNATRACAAKLRNSAILQETLDDLDIYINGCPNACGQQPVGPIGLSGAAQRVEGSLLPSYRISVGGRCNAEGARLGTNCGQVPAKALPDVLKVLAEHFQENRIGCESFNHYCDRKGVEWVKAVATAHAAAPAYEDAPEMYRDFGADEDFSLANRGGGDCAAGVFEIIQTDLAAARAARDPFTVMLHAARALLPARGSDAQAPDEVFRDFETHFVDTGLVAEPFRALLARARGQAQGWTQALEGCQADVKKLLKRVETLYANLNSALQFEPPESQSPQTPNNQQVAESANPADQADAERTTNTADSVEFDLRGIPCPINFVKAKLKLEEDLDVGQRLTIILDDGEPVKNVPASFRKEGQEVEDLTNLGNGQWR
ncbi:MAG: sulfurtransferase TusA family protein, partial [Verrucomicrobiota bacterium]